MRPSHHLASILIYEVCEGYCNVVKKTGDPYLQPLADYLERSPNDEISTRAIAIGNLMIEGNYSGLKESLFSES
ncbi:hypothetical protein [Thermoleptolyngbya sp. M55_K2018_002]|uniref:hypothetical protein n=1 Tax=Thermoleptolyngbya sp. M55_K2018_002 TaxID=2747808 RepID=UPI0019E6A8EB|nr:hypothetical protein [Thermoleptolyngbya sp. M55_K2018_002]HIK39687.1 hypothetical protein [Thermoleptolyngbya sp. M55_K2018_002]